MTGAPGARLEAVTRRFGTRVALDEATFDVATGEVLGLLGPNGAGKTTTMRVLCGYLRPTSGTVSIGGVPVAQDPVGCRSQVGYLPEQVALPADLTVPAYLRYRARIRGIPRSGRRAEVDRVISLAGIGDVGARRLGELSRGYRQRVGLAQALLGDPPVLVLDEPTAGLDPRQVAATRALIARLGRRKAVLFSSHLLSEVSQLCERVVVLDRGRVVATAPVAELTARAGAFHVVVRLADASGAAELLRPLGGVVRVERHGAEVSVWGLAADRVSATLVGAGYQLLELRQDSSTLEDAYLRLVADQ